MLLLRAFKQKKKSFAIITYYLSFFPKNLSLSPLSTQFPCVRVSMYVIRVGKWTFTPVNSDGGKVYVMVRNHEDGEIFALN